MRQFAQRSIRDLSRVDRLKQLDRAERVANDILPSQQYPYRELFRQIADENWDMPSNVTLTGDAALHDLRLFRGHSY